MLIEFDSTKRQKTLEERGIDFCDAPKVFKGIHFTAPDDRMDYSEPRFFTVGCCKSGLWWWFGQPEEMHAELFP